MAGSNVSFAETMEEDGNLCVYRGADYSYGVYGVAIVVLFFQFVNWVVKSIGPPKTLRDDEWKWRNLTISYLHALACVVWTVASFVIYPELMTDLQHFKSHLVVCLVIFSTGYFLYDFLDLVLNGKMFAMWEVQLHHIAVGVMFFYNLVRCEWVGFNVVALLVEVNSFFLHQRKLLQMLGVPYDSRLYRVTVFLNLSTFVVFRGLPLAAILWGMWALYHQVAFYYYICLTGSMFVMVVMNPILFVRLLRSDYLRDPSSSSSRRHNQKKALPIRCDKLGVNGILVNGNNNNNNNNNSKKYPGRVVDHSKQS
ncbi:TLC domain-containing protein 2-like [Babylonia areolata]|uniref:TLC domain-containing protein 2-like n=1 Tax=Babylonia areolata TaxID=304850 RepID=UPI003FD1A3FA